MKKRVIRGGDEELIEESKFRFILAAMIFDSRSAITRVIFDNFPGG
jgi:hypothetical protein